MTKARNAERRLRSKLLGMGIVLMKAGAHAHEDRFVPMYVDQDGATVANREFNAVIAELVRAVLDGRP